MNEFYVYVSGGTITGCKVVHVREIKPEDELRINDFKPDVVKDYAVQISEDGSSVKAGDWAVQLCYDKSGSVIVTRSGWDHPELLPLHSGTIHLQEAPERRAFWGEILPVGIALKERHGINLVSPVSPNRSYQGFTANSGDGICTQRAAYTIITDGEVKTTLLDDPDNSYNPEDPIDLFFYEGTISYKVSNAKWAIIISYNSKPDGEFGDDITLYADASQLNLTCRVLDNFLREHDCSSFADYIERQRADALKGLNTTNTQ